MKTATNKMSHTLDQISSTAKVLEERFLRASKEVTAQGLNIDPSVGEWIAYVEYSEFKPVYVGDITSWLTTSSSSRIGEAAATLVKVVYQNGVFGIYRLDVVCGIDAMDLTTGKALITDATFNVYPISDVASVEFSGSGSYPRVAHKQFRRGGLCVSEAVAVAIAAKLS